MTVYFSEVSNNYITASICQTPKFTANLIIKINQLQNNTRKTQTANLQEILQNLVSRELIKFIFH